LKPFQTFQWFQPFQWFGSEERLEKTTSGTTPSSFLLRNFRGENEGGTLERLELLERFKI
jgi:hypothetical protein